jgi:hypothetical protein
MPTYNYDQNYSIPSLGIQQEKVLTNVLGFEIMLPLNLNLKFETYFKYYYDKYYANATYNDDNERELHHHSNGYGFAGGFDVILKRKISRYLDGWISYSFIFAKFYNPLSDGQDYTYDSNEPTKQWYYPQYHRWHSMNLVLNIKPTNWLTISPIFGVHSGLPKRDIDVKDDTFPKNKGGEIMELYEYDVKYNDINRTLPSLPFSVKITFHHFFPRTKVGFEAYASLDNLFYFFWKPDSREFVDQYTGDILKSDGEAYEVFLPSFGLKITY